MQFVDQWFPLVVNIREGTFDQRELAAMCAGYEHYFQRAEPFAVLCVADVTAQPPEAVVRLRIAEWLNEPRVRRETKEYCVGSATVVARDWERHALSALQWLWIPAIPHEGAASISDGIDYCVDRLVERKIALPQSPELFRAEVYRGLARLELAGLGDAKLFGSNPPPRRVLRRRSGATPGRFETMADRDGCVVIGWLVPGVLWAKFAGHMNEPVCVAYASRLSEILKPTSGVRFFVDSSEMQSCDWAARNAALCALLENAGHLAQVFASEWADELNPTSRQIMAMFGSSVHVLPDRVEFDAKLREAAPQAHEILATGRLSLDQPAP
ncbi:MAG TPA: hypothetical protein VFS67_28115 [Polyangiaceae bacterium]|nr:hypothetical protein [Polyangiaceae bacterium]